MWPIGISCEKNVRCFTLRDEPLEWNILGLVTEDTSSTTYNKDEFTELTPLSFRGAMDELSQEEPPIMLFFQLELFYLKMQPLFLNIYLNQCS